MSKQNRVVCILLAIVLVFGAVFTLTAPAQAQTLCPDTGVPSTTAGVCPVEIDGNATCAGLGFPNGFKINASTFSGLFSFLTGTQNGVPTELEKNSVPPDEPTASLNVTSNGSSVSWSSNFQPIYAVLVKGGSDTNQYLYWPSNPLMADGGLVSPINSSGDPAGVSNVKFCYPEDVTYVELDTFDAEPGENGVTISWTTAVEFENAGFYVYRSDSPDGELVQTTGLISAKGSNNVGASYSIVDNVEPGAYWYTLVDVDIDGLRTEHGPIVVVVGGERVFVPFVMSPMAAGVGVPTQ